MAISLVQVERKYSIYHKTSLNDQIEGLFNFMSGSTSLYVITMPSLGAIGIA